MENLGDIDLDTLNKAANSGKTEFQYELGRRYLFGIGVEKDVGKAIQLFQITADKGLAIAQYNLGVAYDQGYMTGKRDVFMAEKWYRKAAKQGDQMAIDVLHDYDNPKYRAVDVTGFSANEALKKLGLLDGDPMSDVHGIKSECERPPNWVARALLFAVIVGTWLLFRNWFYCNPLKTALAWCFAHFIAVHRNEQNGLIATVCSAILGLIGILAITGILIWLFAWQFGNVWVTTCILSVLGHLLVRLNPSR